MRAVSVPANRDCARLQNAGAVVLSGPIETKLDGSGWPSRDRNLRGRGRKARPVDLRFLMGSRHKAHEQPGMFGDSTDQAVCEPSTGAMEHTIVRNDDARGRPKL